MIIECTELSVRDALRQSFNCLWHYKLQHTLISILAVLPICIAGWLGWLEPVISVTSVTDELPDGFNLSFAILVSSTFLWAFPVIILWHRLYLLGPEHLIRKKIWPLLTRTINIISHSLIFFGMGLLAAIGMTIGVLYLRIFNESEELSGTINEMGQTEYMLYATAIIIILLFLLIISLRLSMAFSAQTIGKKLGFTTSWRITRKNTFRMLFVTLFGCIPMIALAYLLTWSGNHFFEIDLLSISAPEHHMIYSFILVTSPILTLPLAILCSLTSSFYRHCGCAEVREKNL